MPDFRSIEIPLGGGLAQDVGEHQTEPPALLECTDFVLRRGKRYEPRKGSTPIGDSGVLANDYTNAVFTHKQTICQLNTDGVYTYDRVDDAWATQYTNGVFPTEVQKVAAVGVTRRTCNPDVAVNTRNGIVCMVWEESESGRCYASLYDEDTAALLQGPLLLGTSMKYAPRVVAAGDFFLVCAQTTDPRSGAATDVYAQSVNLLGTPPYAFGAQQSIVAGTNRMVDLHSAGTSSVLAYMVTSDGASSVIVRQITVTATPSQTDFNNLGAIGIAGAIYHEDGVAVHVLTRAAASDALNTYRLNVTTLDVLTGPTTILAAASVPAYLSSAFLRYSLRKWDANELIAQISTYAGITTGSAAPVKWGVYTLRIANSDHTVNDSWATPRASLHLRGNPPGTHAPVFGIHNWATEIGESSLPDNPNQTYPAALLATVNDTVAGTHELKILSRYQENPPEPADSTLDADNKYHMGQIALGSDGETLWYAATEVRRDEGSDSYEVSTVQTVVNLYQAKVTNADERTIVRGEDLTILGAGVLGCWDGHQAAEIQFLGAPIIVDFTESGLGGGATPNETWYASIVLSWMDAAGKIHRSPPSNWAVRSVTVTDPIDFQILFCPPPTAINGDGGRQWMVDLYLTSGTAGGTVSETDARYYRGSFIPTVVTGDEAVYQIDFPVLDATTTGVTQEYGQTEELLSDPPLAVVDVRTNKDRVFYIPPSRDRVYFSKPFTDTYAPEFPSENYILLPPEGGAAVALETFDDRLVIFKERAIYTTSVGSGPDANGNGPQFPLPRRVPGDVGCRSRESVVLIPAGALFQGERTIYLLDRNTNVTPIGAAVQEDLKGNRVTSAYVAPATSEAVFYHDGVFTHQGESNYGGLVYNYESGVWYRRSARLLMTSAFPVGPEGNLDALLASFNYVFGHVGVDASFYSTENGSKTTFVNVLPSLSTPWIKLNGIQGYERIRSVQINGIYTGHDIVVELYYDYSTSVGTTYFFRGTSFTSGAPYQIEAAPSGGKAKCRAIKIRVYTEDTYGATGGGIGNVEVIPGLPYNAGAAGFTVEGIQLEVKVAPTSGKTLSSTFKTTNP